MIPSSLVLRVTHLASPLCLLIEKMMAGSYKRKKTLPLDRSIVSHPLVFLPSLRGSQLIVTQS
jgi:hypothetical protein